MIIRRLFVVSIIVLFALPAAPAAAHDTRPLYINIDEGADSAIRLRWNTPPSVQPGQGPSVTLAGCDAAGENRPAGQLEGAALYACPQGLSGATVRIAYPLYNPSLSSLVRVEFSTGETRTAILDPSVGEWRIPAQENFKGVAENYFRVGVRHILGGIDHLLFLAGLLYIARRPKRVLVTVTGFTMAHSLTIFLVALNVIRVSVPAVESVIALSIVFLASEIARNNRATLTWRRPILVASGFGLAHGAGFAAALSEIGLPQTEKITALAFFNIGVEAGQLCVVLSVFALGWAASKLMAARSLSIDEAPFRPAFGYGLGTLSALWFFQRLAGALA